MITIRLNKTPVSKKESASIALSAEERRVQSVKLNNKNKEEEERRKKGLKKYNAD